MGLRRNSVGTAAKLLPLPKLPVGNVKSSYSDDQQPSGSKLSCLSSTEVDRAVVEAQLARLLVSQYFRISERYTGLLRFVVRSTLQNQTDLLKERLIGIHVFGRDPSYDTLADNVVRVAAAEVRSRLVRYYAQPEHTSELRIVLYPGSYIPRFVRSDIAPISAAKAQNSESLLHRFWGPLIDSNGPILIVLGTCPMGNGRKIQSGSELPGTTVRKLEEQIPLSDAINLANIVSWIKAHGKDYRVELEDFVRYRDLRNGPVVLLGGSNNQWTLAFAKSLRFAFKSNRENSKSWICDKAAPGRPKWVRNLNVHSRRMTEDYAIVARVLHAETGQAMILAGGHTMYGTAAAGEFLTRASYLEEFASNHRDWESKDLEIVLATNIFLGISGPPRIQATHVW